MIIKIFQYIQLSFENLLINKLRSFLTMLGIIIGVFNIILVMAVLQGGREMILKELGSLGSNVIHVDSLSEDSFTEEDIFAIKRIPEVDEIIPEAYIFTQLKIERNTQDVFIYCSSYRINKILDIDISEGRFLLKGDEEQKRKVCVIGEKLKEELFKEVSPIGKELKIKDEIFKIIGVAKEKTVLSKMMGAYFIYIPLSTGQRMLETEKIMGLKVIAKDIRNINALTEKIKKIFNKKPGSFSVHNMQEFIDTTKAITAIIAFVILLIASISLIVGGINIMNIMLVQVRERTREIGIRKAFGASNQDILIQFLIESCILSLSGGIIGIFLGLLIANIITFFVGFSLLINLWYVFAGFIVAFLVGIFFGIYPARIAAKLDPIEALRYE